MRMAFIYHVLLIAFLLNIQTPFTWHISSFGASENPSLIYAAHSESEFSSDLPELGVIQSIKKDSVMYAAGYRYIEESVTNSFSPRNVSEKQFSENLDRFRRSKLQVYSCNVFVPGSLKLVGPAVNERAVLGFADTVFSRCKAAGVALVVLGSGEARRIPVGYDSVKASKEFIILVRKMAELASVYGITIAIENLNY